jgi:hypothetical protein
VGIKDTPPNGEKQRRLRWRRARSAVPAAESRAYIHPSELPGDFEQLLSSVPEPTTQRMSLGLLSGSVVLLLVGSLALYSTETSTPDTEAMREHVALSLRAIPHVGQGAAASSIQLTTQKNGRLVSGGAIIVGNGDVAVTTLQLDPHDSITGSTFSTPRMKVRWMAFDRHLGLTYLHLPFALKTTAIANHNEVEAVLVISPYVVPSSKKLGFAYATTVLSDPRRTTNDGIVSYLTATSPSQLHGLTGSFAIDDAGDVVAILARNGQWITAEYIARVATAWLAAPNCHGRLGISGVPAEGGGVRVTSVGRGPSFSKLAPGDVITALNEKSVDTMDGIVTELYATAGRTSMVVQFLRDQRPSFVVVRLACLS